MLDAPQTRAAFIDRLLTSRLPGQEAKRFPFADGEVAAMYTLSRQVPADVAQQVVLFVAAFPPTQTSAGGHDFGLGRGGPGATRPT